MKRTIGLCGIALAVLLVASLGCDFAGNLLGQTGSDGPQVIATVPALKLPESQSDSIPAPTESQPAQPEAEASPTAELEAAPPAEDPGELQGCEEEVCILPGSFFLQRPISTDRRNYIDTAARFGSYVSELKSAWHSVFFLNSTGTPVLAAADGVVVAAGDDSSRPQALFRDFYGNLVIIEHTIPEVGEPVYTLYGHLSEVSVEVGDPVQAGDEIGKVGSSGNAAGSTLLFEVRVGDNHYDAARNPELWLEPLPDKNDEPTGALAGRVIDSDGNYLKVDNIVLEQLAGPRQRALETYYLKTYAENRLQGDNPWRENFAMGGLPAGEYQITFYYGPDLVQREVEVEPGSLTVVNIEVP